MELVWGSTAPGKTGAGVKLAVIDTGIDVKHPDLKAAGVRAELITRVRDLGDPGRDEGYGYGIVDYSE